MIFEESCDTEGWSKELKIQLCITEIHFKIYSIEKSYFNGNNISQYYCFYCNFGQINAALVSIRDFAIQLKWTKKNF